MRMKWLPIILCCILFLSACITTAEPPDQSNEGEETSELIADEDSTLAENNNSDSPPITATEIPPTETPIPDVVHWEFPGKFSLSPLQRIFDCVLGNQVEPGSEIILNEQCDDWNRNYFERPVDEEISEFYPQLDIVQGEFGEDENWFYTRISLFSGQVENLILDGVYAVEIDTNLDAKGDILITATAPGTYTIDEWISDGVKVWLDANDDVGGPQAMLVDPRYDGDGYETLIYDSGIGDDPDLAFVKTYSDQPHLLEFGFKRELIAGADSFEWWIWAMAEELSAAKYDPVDFFPQDSLFAMDNTCGWIFGSYARDLPNICQTIAGPKQSPSDPGGICQPPPGTCDQPCEWWDVSTCTCLCFN